jgi:hypothetical protein
MLLAAELKMRVRGEGFSRRYVEKFAFFPSHYEIS